MNPYAADFSDDDSRKSTAEQSSTGDTKGRRRSTRACDHCRRTKSKCEQPTGGSRQPKSCHACAALGLSCTFADPTHKRGPPKGYILALERRLHQVEALLGTIISSDDPRARSLVQDLSRDKLANHVINKVHVGPFGPAGREKHPFSSTKEDFLTSITGDLGDNMSEQSSSSQDAQNDPAFFTPSSDWQDHMKSLLIAARAEASMAASVASPQPDTKPRRATYPSINSSHVPVPYMQAYYESQPPHPPPPSTSSVYYEQQQHSLVQASAMRSSATSSHFQGTGLVPTVSNIYTDQDGRFRFDTTPPMLQDDLNGQSTASSSDAAAHYYSSFRRQ